MTSPRYPERFQVWIHHPSDDGDEFLHYAVAKSSLPGGMILEAARQQSVHPDALVEVLDITPERHLTIWPEEKVVDLERRQGDYRDDLPF